MGHTHRGHRSSESMEFRSARQFCFRHCKYDRVSRERVFVGYPEQTLAFVEVSVENPCLSDVPDTPQGLVLADSRGGGAFE